MPKTDILSLSLAELVSQVEALGEKKFRAKQVFQWLHQKRAVTFEEMTNLSSALKTKLDDNFCINRLKVVGRLESSVDDTVKYLYELSDGNHVESVQMRYHHGDSLCISTQVGCKMGCQFCASAIAGFRRNLEPSEMLLQLYTAEQVSERKISSMVLMGIGEPLDNFENVTKFLELLSDPEGTNMSLRHVSLSTCGLAERIDELAELRYGLTLSVSLHAADNATRSEIMPVNQRYPIEKLLQACRRYTDQTGRRISFEYAVISGVNDSRADAERLAGLLRGMLCHVNLIPVNKIKERDYRSDRGSALRFCQHLLSLGLNATVRRTLGADIDAACGQLRREYEAESAT